MRIVLDRSRVRRREPAPSTSCYNARRFVENQERTTMARPITFGTLVKSTLPLKNIVDTSFLDAVRALKD
jgi:hypothetical protein